MSESRHELFHRISDLESAAIRRLIDNLGLKNEIDFRNVDLGEEAADDLKKRGGSQVPSLWTGEELISGRQDIENYLHWVTEEPFPELLQNFDEIAAEVWEDVRALIPSDLQKHVDQVQFWIFDEPTPEILADLPKELSAHPDELCGLHVGTPLTERSLLNPDPDPVRVYLFRWAHIDLLEPEDLEPEKILREEIAITLVHEIGHYFGLTEQDLDRLGYS